MDETYEADGKSAVKALSNSQRLQSCWEYLIVRILSHTQIYQEEQGECTFFFWGKKDPHLLVFIYVHTHIYTHTYAGGSLECEAERQFYPINGSVPDLCFASVSFTFTTRIIFASQHISKDCYVDSYLLSAQKCERLTTLVSKWTGLDLPFFFFILLNIVPKSTFKHLWLEYLYNQFTLYKCNMFSGTHSWESSWGKYIRSDIIAPIISAIFQLWEKQ